MATQSIGSATNTTYDYSQRVKPDWLHTASYIKLGKSVIEVPLDPGSKFTADFKSMPDNKVYADKKYSRTYFLFLNDGHNYEAYVMTIMADPAYIKNDLSKLTRNTYRSLDADFSGLVLYFTPTGRYLGGYGYVNGQLLAPTNPPQDGQQTLSVKDDKSKKATDQAETQNITTCTYYYEGTYEDDVLVSLEYLGAVCTIQCTSLGNEGCGTGGSGGGGTGGVTPPPTTCPGTFTGTGTGTGKTPIPAGYIINVAQTTTTNASSGPPAPTDPCTVTTTTNGLKILFCGGLTSAEQISITNTVNAFSNEDCVSKYLFSYFSNQTFSFCISPGNYNVIFNPQNNSFTFSTADAATPAFASLLEHEFFHAFQNATYPGGITSYGQNSSTGVNSAGFVNIEFEQAIFNDIATKNYNAFNGGTLTQQTAYKTWINGLTNNGTAYPKLTPSSAAYTQFINSYNSFLSQYNAIPNNPNSSVILPTLSPKAFINLFNSTNPNC